MTIGHKKIGWLTVGRSYRRQAWGIELWLIPRPDALEGEIAWRINCAVEWKVWCWWHHIPKQKEQA